MTTTALTALGGADFDRHLTAAPEPLLVEFWATGCRPCRALMPLLREIAAEYAGRLRAATVKRDDAPDLDQHWTGTREPLSAKLPRHLGHARCLQTGRRSPGRPVGCCRRVAPGC